MTKKNQYYKLIEYVQKNNIAKVFNFRTNKVEEYLTIMTKKEKFLQKQRRLKQSIASKEVKPVSTVVNNSNDSSILLYQANYFPLRRWHIRQEHPFQIFSKVCRLSPNFSIVREH